LDVDTSSYEAEKEQKKQAEQTAKGIQNKSQRKIEKNSLKQSNLQILAIL
jgi:hypothetical protein